MSTPAEAVAAEIGAAPPAVEPAAPAARDPGAPILPQKTAGDLARDAIFARHIAKRAEIGDASTQAMAEGVVQMQGEPPAAPIAPINPQLEGFKAAPAAPAAPVATAPVQPAPPANSPVAPLAQTQDMVTITVEGRQIAVPRAQIFEHGVRTLQKESAADIRLQRVTLAEQQLAMERQALDRRAAEIDAARATTPTGAAPASGSGPLPPGGQPASPQPLKKALDALLDGDTESAGRALEGMVAERVDSGVRAALAARQPTAPTAQPTAAGPPAPWSQKEIDDTNALFRDSFPEIYNDPAALSRASNRMVQEMAHPVNRMGKVPLANIAVRIAREAFMGATAPVSPASPPANSADELAARRTLAARVPGLPPLAGPRNVNPPPAAPVLSPSEKVNQMRKARGQAVM